MGKEIFKKDDVNAQAQVNRDYEYSVIGQPIFMKVQLGQATMEEFRQTISDIDSKYPFVTEDLVIDTEDVISVNINEVLK